MKKFWRRQPPGIQVWHVRADHSSDSVVDLEWRITFPHTEKTCTTIRPAEICLDVRSWTGYGHSMPEFQDLFSRLEAAEICTGEYGESAVLEVLDELGYEEDQDHVPL